MSDIERILWTSSATLVGGVVVLVVGQIVTRFLIEPLHEQRKIIGRIAEALMNYAHFIADSGDSPPPGAQHAADELRRLSSELLAKTMAVAAYRTLSLLRCVPSWTRVTAASRALFEGGNKLVISRMWEDRVNAVNKVAVQLRFAHIDPYFRTHVAVTPSKRGTA